MGGALSLPPTRLDKCREGGEVILQDGNQAFVLIEPLLVGWI